MQVSCILFRVSLFNRFVIEKEHLQFMNIEHILSAVSLTVEVARLPPSPGCGSGYPSIISKLLPYNFRGNSLMFSRVCCPLNENSLERILLATLQDTVVCHCHWRRPTFPPS